MCGRPRPAWPGWTALPLGPILGAKGLVVCRLEATKEAEHMTPLGFSACGPAGFVGGCRPDSGKGQHPPPCHAHRPDHREQWGLTGMDGDPDGNSPWHRVLGAGMQALG